jgi:hypothetical protein
MYLTRIPEVIGSNLGMNMGSPDSDFHRFPQPFQAHAMILPLVG